MGYSTIVGLLVIAVIIGLVVINTRIALAGNSKVLNRLYNSLQRVRLFKMLRRRGVDVGDYLRKTEVSDMRRQIARCETCQNIRACDSALEREDAAGGDISFCPNKAALELYQGDEDTTKQESSFRAGVKNQAPGGNRTETGERKSCMVGVNLKD